MVRAVGLSLRSSYDTSSELGFRSAVVRAGFWLGWVSIVTVVAGLAFDVEARHRGLLIGLTLTAAAANTVAMAVPWRQWLAARRGRVLLDLWSGGLIGFVAMLVIAGGSSFALLLFLAVPFIAVVQVGRRRRIWLALSAATCIVVAILMPVSAGATAMRLGLLAAAVGVALVLARTIRSESAARSRAAERLDLERTLAKEANHRIKNDLQTVADLLLLGRPDSDEGRAFDDTAARIRSIATVHRLLTEAEDSVDASALLHSIAESAPVPIIVDAALGRARRFHRAETGNRRERADHERVPARRTPARRGVDRRPSAAATRRRQRRHRRRACRASVSSSFAVWSSRAPAEGSS